jgi:HSP20 family protein
MCILHTN